MTLISPILSKEENDIVLAHIGEKQLRQFVKADLKALDNYLLDLSEMTGVNPPPEPSLRKSICKILYDQFSEFTLSDIKKAMTMALGHKLTLEANQINNYNRLSVQWITTILVEYRKIMAPAIFKHEKHQEQSKEKELTDEKKEAIVRNGCIECFDRYKKTNELHDIGGVTCRYLLNVGVMKLRKHQKDAYMEKAKTVKLDHLKRQKSNASSIKMQEILKEIDEIVTGKDLIHTRIVAHKLALKDFFDFLIKEKKHLKEYLK